VRLGLIPTAGDSRTLTTEHLDGSEAEDADPAAIGVIRVIRGQRLQGGAA